MRGIRLGLLSGPSSPEVCIVISSRHGREALHEALEAADPRALVHANEHEVVDAAVLLQHVDEIVQRHTIELGAELGAQRFATVELGDLLRMDLALGELQEQM